MVRGVAFAGTEMTWPFFNVNAPAPQASFFGSGLKTTSGEFETARQHLVEAVNCASPNQAGAGGRDFQRYLV